MTAGRDRHWLGLAARLAERGRPLSRPNPAVGAVIVRDGRIVGRGWTQPGGRPHAEAEAFAMAGDGAAGATLYVTLEPCAHDSSRGPSCSATIARSGVERVVAACLDPDPRTAGRGMAGVAVAGIAADIVPCPEAEASLAGYLSQRTAKRPYVTLKLATSLDGQIALADGRSRWITGEAARAHAHLERARSDAIVVGSGTWRADAPALDVRLPGLEVRSPERWVLSRSTAPSGWRTLFMPSAITDMADVQYLLVEGGAGAAAAFLAQDLIDRLLIYRAPIVIGRGRAAIGDLGLEGLEAAHGRWRFADRRQLGRDSLEVYERRRCSPE